MRNRLTAVIPIVAAVMLLVSPAARADEEAEKKAIAAAETWLALIDQGKIAESWETSAVLFRGAVTQEQWQQTMSGTRGPLGKVIFRKVQIAKYETQLPGAPDGEYVIVQFKSAFENKINAIETVTPMKDPDGQWRVSGYHLK